MLRNYNTCCLVFWDFNSETGELIISGMGVMQSYSYSSESNTADAPWYSFCNSIKTVTFEDGVTSIGDYSFYNCTNLSNVTVPNSVKSIGKSAFYKCAGLTRITIPDSITDIGNSAFSNCTGLLIRQ